jgi:predicted permease
MVMAHAPIILPAVLRRPLPYRAVMWIPLGLMHIGLAIRVVAGDLVGHRTLWQTGSIINIVALLLFFAVAAGSSIAGPVARPARQPRDTVAATPSASPSDPPPATPTSTRSPS